MSGDVPGASWIVFVMGLSLIVLIMTNFIMNVAVIAIALPVSLVIARYLGLAPEMVLFAWPLMGMPILVP